MNSAQYLIDNLRIIFIIQKYIKKEITVNFIKSNQNTLNECSLLYF